MFCYATYRATAAVQRILSTRIGCPQGDSLSGGTRYPVTPAEMMTLQIGKGGPGGPGGPDHLLGTSIVTMNIII